MSRILLLNLPYKNKMLQRDFSCPHSSKADYYWPPIDLVVYSGELFDNELVLIDAVQERMNFKELINKISLLKPDFIFTIISALSFENDINIIKEIKKINQNVIICASGDLCSFQPENVKKHREIDFIISDFTEIKEIRKIVGREQKKRIIRSSKNKEFEIGIPWHELFKKYKYRLPYSFHQPIASIITNYGCPFKCKFCNSSNLKFKSRKIDEIIEELRYIKKTGIKEVYIRDFTFGIPKIKELLILMAKENLDIKWSCEFRVDLVDEEILKMMKKAGCYLIFYGGESGNQRTLDLMNKGFNLEQAKKAVALTKQEGIETLMSFIIGFEFESEDEIMNTSRFIKAINPDYISVNILVPRIGSKFRDEIMSNEITKLDNSEEQGIKYKSGMFALDYKNAIERDFFFNPGKMMRYLSLSLKTYTRFTNFMKSGLSIFSRINSRDL